MCGRFALINSPDEVQEFLATLELEDFPARYNIAPTQPIGIVRLVDGKRHFALVRWGLLPSWVKDPKAFSLIINARGEGAAAKPAFRAAMKRRRCLIPADGFYEWKAGAPRKQPYYIHAKSGAPLVFAGLWETWTGPNGEEMDTAAIVTTAANKTVADIHDRMPVMLSPDQFELWLDSDRVRDREAAEILKPLPDDAVEAHPVSHAVNHVANDNPELVEPVEAAPAPAPKQNRAAAKMRAREDEGQGSLF